MTSLAQETTAEQPAEAPKPTAGPTPLLDANGEAWIPESKLEPLQAKAAKLNRRAAKLGCPPIGVEPVGERFIPVRKHNGVEWVVVGRRREVLVRVTGAAPQVAGWTFVARIEHGPVGNIVSRAPSERGMALSEDLWLVDPVCEHCNLSRRRRDTFVLRDEQGTVKRVGRNCLADFLREADVANALAFWKFLREVELEIGGSGEDDEDFGGGCRERVYFGTGDVLRAAASAIRVDGWVSRSAAKDDLGISVRASTADTVSWILDPPKPSRDERIAREEAAKRALYEEKPEADGKVAAEALEWVRHRLDPTSDYERNLKVALTADFVDPRNLGLAVSGMQAWLRQVARREAENRPAAPDAGWLGEKGQRLRKIRARVIDSRVWTSEVTGFTTNLIVFVDEAGHELKWFASGSRGLAIGRDVVLTGTVKEHAEWKGRKGTILSRCVVEV